MPGILLLGTPAVSLVLHNACGCLAVQGWVAEQLALVETLLCCIHNQTQGRYVLDDSVDPPRIRAAQGHSFELSEPVLQRVSDPADVPVAVHVTSEDG